MFFPAVLEQEKQPATPKSNSKVREKRPIRELSKKEKRSIAWQIGWRVVVKIITPLIVFVAFIFFVVIGTLIRQFHAAISNEGLN